MTKNSSPVWKHRVDRKDPEFEEVETTIGNVEISITRNEEYNRNVGFDRGSWDTVWTKKGTSKTVYGGEVFTDLEEAKKYALSRVEVREKEFAAKPKRTRRPKGPGISYSIYD